MPSAEDFALSSRSPKPGHELRSDFRECPQSLIHINGEILDIIFISKAKSPVESNHHI